MIIDGKSTAALQTLEILKLFGHPIPLLQELKHKATTNSIAQGINFFEMFIFEMFNML